MEPKTSVPVSLGPEGRLLSLDFFRGLTMFLLIGEWTHLYSILNKPELKGTIWGFIGTQFHHHPWNGLHFWDLVQPFFMFIVGVAIPLSIAKRLAKGQTWTAIRRHAFQRAFLLLLFGWALYCIGPGRITFRFQNVLAQLSFTYLVAFLLARRSVYTQLGVSFAFLIVTEILYRTFPVPGFNQPFVPDHNFGAWVDMLISGELSHGHWVSFNAVPTAAHTIWGVLAGLLLMSEKEPKDKIRILVVAGLIGLALGYALNPITPIIKRIATSSFVIVTGGWCLLALAFSYWLIDVKKISKWSRFFAIVGMNPLFIYLFAHTGGAEWLHGIVKPFGVGFFSWISPTFAQIVIGLTVWGMMWYMTYWLYRRKIFIKL